MIYSIFIQQLLFGIIALLITYVTGKIITVFTEFNSNFFFRLFVTYIIGITTIVLFYSIFKAHGRTVNILLLPIIGYLIYYYGNKFRKKPHIDYSEMMKEFLWSLFPFVILFLFQSWFYFDFGKGELKPLFIDNYWFGNFSESLKSWGSESNLAEMNFFYPEYRNTIIPYHFPELWLTALFSAILKNSTTNTYYYISYQLLLNTFLLGITSIIYNGIKNKITVLIIALILLVTTGFPISLIPINSHNTWGILDISGQKLAFIYCFILLSFILIQKKNWDIGIIILATIPLFSFAFVPGLFFGIIVFSLLQSVYKIFFLKTKVQLKPILLILFLIVSYFVFYALHKPIYNDTLAIKKVFSTGIFKGINGNYSIHNIKTIVLNFIVYSIPTILIHVGVRLYLFLIFLLLFFRTALKNKSLFILIISVIIGGAIASTLSRELFDSNQFIEVLSSLLICFIILLISESVSTFRFSVKPIILTCSLLFIYFGIFSETLRNKNIGTNNDFQFIKTIEKCLSKNPTVILIFNSKNEVKNSPAFHFLLQDNDLKQLAQVSNKTLIFTIGNPDLYSKLKVITTADSIFLLFRTPLIYWEKKSINNNLNTFINHYNIKYCYFKAGAEVPEFIRLQTLKTIESPITHCKFIVLK